MSVTIINLTAGAPAGASGYAAADTAIALANGGPFGAVAPAVVDDQNIGSIYSAGTSAPAGTHVLITSASSGVPCGGCCCPPFVVGYSDFLTMGATDTPTLFGGHVFKAASWSQNGIFTIVVDDWIPQNSFAAVELVDSLLGDITLTSAAATFSQAVSGVPPNENITLWQWALGQVFNAGPQYHLIFT